MPKIIKAQEAPTHYFRRYEAEEAVVLSEFTEIENPYEFSEDDPVSSAEHKAIGIVDKALKKAREIERQAFERGYQAGESASRENMQRQAADIASRFAETLGMLSELEDRTYRQSEHNMVDLSLKIARKIIDREVTVQPDIVLELVRRCVMRVSGSPYLRVRVSPEDYGRIYEFKSSIPVNPERVKSFAIEADPAIDPGGCIVETGSGSIDARIGKQISEISKVLLAKC